MLQIKKHSLHDRLVGEVQAATSEGKGNTTLIVWLWPSCDNALLQLSMQTRFSVHNSGAQDCSCMSPQKASNGVDELRAAC